jgi:LmbE family N-acetylglucosaminyl deacetylase
MSMPAAARPAQPPVENIFVICAHSDDQILGAGGTLAKYAIEGKRIITVVLSYGELTHVWYKPKEIIKTRINESLKADQIIKGHGVYFFGLKEGRFLKEFTRKKVNELVKLFKRFPPSKLFTHTTDDSHPDHVATAKLVLSICKAKRISAPVYGFDIWKTVNLRHRQHPKLIMDITPTFETKIKALRCFKSQALSIYQLLIKVHYNALMQGLKHGYQYAEVFYRMHPDDIADLKRWKPVRKSS